MELFPTWTLTLLLGIIVILVVFLNTNFKEKKREPDENAFEHFLEEWQIENEALLRAFSEMQNDVLSRIERLQERVDSLESKTDEDDTSRTKTDLHHRYADIFELAENGMSIAEIARETGRGNGEVQLILGLARGQSHD